MFLFLRLSSITFCLLYPPFALSYRQQVSWLAHPGATEAAWRTLAQPRLPSHVDPPTPWKILHWPTKSRSFPLASLHAAAFF
jgi:hypothetical protein